MDSNLNYEGSNVNVEVGGMMKVITSQIGNSNTNLKTIPET